MPWRLSYAGAELPAARARLLPGGFRRTEGSRDSEGGRGCWLGPGFSGVLFTFSLAIVLENQIIQQWNFSLEYGSGGQRSQAGIGAGKRRWLVLRMVARHLASARPSCSETRKGVVPHRLMRPVKAVSPGFPISLARGGIISQSTRKCPGSFRLRQQCLRWPPPS